MAFWGGLTNSCEKKRGEKQRKCIGGRWMAAGGRGWNVGCPKCPNVKKPDLNPACDRFRDH